MTITIDKDIPLPPKRGRRPHYPFDMLEINDSFLVEAGKYASVRSLVSRHNCSGEKKFSVRVVDESFCRVWRTK